MKKILIILSILTFLALIAYGLFLFSKSRTHQSFGILINRVKTAQKVIALTFDDAPSSNSDEILAILNQKGIKATFYVTGHNLETYPSSAKNIANQGHELGNHSYSHQRFLFKSLSFIDTEIQKTNQLIRNLGYLGQITFRPPFGKKLFLLPWYLAQHKIISIMCDVEPDTYVPGNTKAIIDYTLKHTQPGSILLFHPFCDTACQSDREALPQVIDQLQAKGYSFVTISELLKYD